MEKSFKKQKDKLSIFKNLRQRNRKNKNTREIPEDLFKKCPHCNEIQTSASYKDNVCPNCGFHLPMNAYERMDLIYDGRYKVLFTTKEAPNPLDFPGYGEKIDELKQKTKLDEAVVCSIGHIGKIKCVVCVMDNRFMMGSMGSVVGEKITKAIEFALKKKLPLIIFTTSGGARMQEGIFSLMQMAKVNGALARFKAANLLYVSYITHPTYGGVSASFAPMGDIVIGEPFAMYGFAGRRVIASTIKQKLPDDFQTTKYNMDAGFIDLIVERSKCKQTLGKILAMHQGVRHG
ncbi:MAG: acetyl-CoA carboxylase carboxyltransferase subunit beta [Erysipelotrichaceae bacterium]|nr:acetyl-CoA carboxylase carboxyltransferase subunit beta [Erysipelotrichaceae bacterium]MDD3809454.1 acetyl-CoA carboxylase carboxyltransferase subunit beta [Erysipelotrichaceae bacterium]